MNSVEEVPDGVGGRAVRALHLDLERSRVVLDLEGMRLHFDGVVSSTLLGPWDGSRAHIEWIRLVHRDAGRLCFELRLQYEEVPRVYRLVCARWKTERI